MEKKEYETKNEVEKEVEENEGNVSQMNAGGSGSNQKTTIHTMPCSKRVQRDRNKKWGSTRFQTLRPVLNDKIPNVAEQTEASKKVLQLVAECKYSLTQVNGQRRFGPPSDWTGPAPGPGCEIFVGKIPRMLYEHDIYPVFSSVGSIYEIRLMMDFSGMNRGYCFIMYTKPEDASRAVKELDHYEIRPGRRIGVVVSINYCRLYINQLPADIKAEAVVKRIFDITDDVDKVAVYRNNSGSSYALISYKTHRGAAMGRRRLVPEAATLFPGNKINVEWAHPNFCPSNVLEECGTCDQDGNVMLTKTFVRSTEPRRSSIRRSSRKSGLLAPRVMNEIITTDWEKLQEMLQSLPSNFDRSSASLQGIRVSDEQNQYDQKMSAIYQDPSHHQDNAAEHVDRSTEIANLIPKLYDVMNLQNDRNSNLLNPTKQRVIDHRESSFQVERVVPNPYQQRMFIESNFDLGVPNGTLSNHSPKPDCLEGSSLASNINPLATPFGQQGNQLCGTILSHCNIDQSCIFNNPTPNNPIDLNDPVPREVSLKLQAKALFQPHGGLWSNGSVQSNSFYQPNGSLQPNCNLPDGSPRQNNFAYYNTCLPGFSSQPYPEQPPYRDYSFNNVDNFNQNRMLTNRNSLQQQFCNNIVKMSTRDATYALSQLDQFNREQNERFNRVNNQFVSPAVPPMYYYPSQNQFSSGRQSKDENLFRRSKVPLERYSQEGPRTPRPILNRAHVNGSDD
ncbi:hypothetical protein KPH14_008585 [Odynerus spinipes]|uniref:RRM domain-containing protein n=1 Tax=Odynerus spinipes TaxID=1348599 RepID=A0AAD9RSC5_9HYME|nr:hypothetical protein KPH14_008585 [Odynerus spinipes]